MASKLNIPRKLIGTRHEHFFSFSQNYGRILAYKLAAILSPGRLPPRIFIDNGSRAILVGNIIWSTIFEATDESQTFVAIITPSFNARVREMPEPIDELIYAFLQKKTIKSIWIHLDPVKDYKRLNPYLRNILDCGMDWLRLPENDSLWNEEEILRYLSGSHGDVWNERIMTYQLSRSRRVGRYQAGPRKSAEDPVHPSKPRNIIFETQPAAYLHQNAMENILQCYKVDHETPLYGTKGIYRKSLNFSVAHVCIILMAQYPTPQEDDRLLQIVNYAQYNNIRIIAVLLGNLSPDKYDRRLQGFHRLVKRRLLVRSDDSWSQIINQVAQTMACMANHRLV